MLSFLALTTTTASGEQWMSVATEAMGKTGGFFKNLDWTNPSWDLFIVLFFLIASLIYGLSLGRDRILVILIAIYMALAVVNYAPFAEKLIKGTTLEDFFLIKVLSFAAVFLILFFLLARSALLHTIGAKSSGGSWWQVFVFSILHVGLLISITLSFLPASITQQLSEFTYNVFVTETARFIWIIMPIVVMALVRKPKRRRQREIDEYM